MSTSPPDPRKPATQVHCGVLLANLGSPAAPTPGAVRTYLREFLSDPSVVDVSPLLWWFLLRLIILPFRSPRSARLYRSVWMPEGAPLVVHSGRQRDLLAKELGPGWQVALGMRYGAPSLESGLEELERAGCRRVVLLSLFPQASRTTTGTLEEEVRRLIAKRDTGLELIVAPPYPADEGYIAALAARVSEAQAEQPADHLVFSLHGLPTRYVDQGDPYRDDCEATARALAEALGLAADEWTLTYQSRFGREPWLEPDTETVVAALAKEHGRVLVTCPGFPADCLETLEEIGLRLPEAARKAGGGEVRVVPCLNDHPLWIETLASFARRAAGRG